MLQARACSLRRVALQFMRMPVYASYTYSLVRFFNGWNTFSGMLVISLNAKLLKGKKVGFARHPAVMYDGHNFVTSP